MLLPRVSSRNIFEMFIPPLSRALLDEKDVSRNLHDAALVMTFMQNRAGLLSLVSRHRPRRYAPNSKRTIACS